MKVFDGFCNIPNLSLALGFFDGVHKGHEVVLKNAVQFAVQNNSKSGVILFDKHPSEILFNKHFEHLIPLGDKLDMLSALNFDYAFVIKFTPEFSQISPHDYVENILVKYFSPCAITTGFSHTFGKNAEGTPVLLENLSSSFGYKYFQIPPVTFKNHSVCSSAIRRAVKNSDFDLAKDLLGYDFYVKSFVVHGNEIARTFGFPTANIVYPEDIVKIDTGVFLTRVTLHGKSYFGLLNYGFRPTLGKDEAPVCEVFIDGVDENLYGRSLKIEFLSKIRDEQKFASFSDLKKQIQKDLKFLQNYPG